MADRSEPRLLTVPPHTHLGCAWLPASCWSRGALARGPAPSCTRWSGGRAAAGSPQPAPAPLLDAESFPVGSSVPIGSLGKTA